MRAGVRELGARSVRAGDRPVPEPVFGASATYSIFYAGDDYVAGARLLGIDRAGSAPGPSPARRRRHRRRRQPRLVADLRARCRGGADPRRLRRPAAPPAPSAAAASRRPSRFRRAPSRNASTYATSSPCATALRLLMIGPRRPRCRRAASPPWPGTRTSGWVGACPTPTCRRARRDTPLRLPYGELRLQPAGFPSRCWSTSPRAVASSQPTCRPSTGSAPGLVTDSQPPRPTSPRRSVRTCRTPLTAEEFDRHRRFAFRRTSWENRVRQLAGLLGLAH